MSRTATLPIDAILPAIVKSLGVHANLVIEAAPGAGKTTRVPPALLKHVAGNVIVLEPRRIAARMAARRVAWELGEEVGETVGYQVRFDEAVGPRTRLRFVTEGILTRRLLRDTTLAGVDIVVLDEFHERHLDSDLALALLYRLQRTTRPELKIIVMSATLDAAPIAHFLGNCPMLRSEGRSFPLAIRHTPYSPDPIHLQVKRALAAVMAEEREGQVLIFLPGIAEIRRAMRECESVAQSHGLLMLPLHGDLTPAEQDRAVSPSVQRRAIFATNVAESSVTVEGVNIVIDSGLARVASYSHWTGLPTLEITRISQASARQRAGRAGRTGPGRVVRLYPEEDYARRPEHDAPEIARSDLSQLALALRVMKTGTLADDEWLDAPPAAAMTQAEALLDRLGATPAMAEELVRYPLPPRLARMLVAAVEHGVGDDGCVAAALLSLGDRSAKTDLLEALETATDARLSMHANQLRRIARPPKQTSHEDDPLLLSALLGFPDRVARQRAGNQVMLSTGVSAELDGSPRPYEFMLVLDAEDRKEKPLPLVRLTARIEPEWLIDLFPELVREDASLTWNRSAERVEKTTSLRYDALTIQESRATPNPGEAATLLLEKALETGIENFVDQEALNLQLARMRFAGMAEPELPEVFAELCQDLKSFAELRVAARNFVALLSSKVDTRTLNQLAPESVKLPGGRALKIHYEQDRPPWIESRLQDFFGMRETPRIGPDQAPLVVHLLAPNRRAVQMTTDLAGFWQRLYPEVRRELMRRYPRHQWPEKP